MPEPNTRSDPVNVEQIMQRIRARIREKRGMDYTEQQLRQLATARLEGFLGPQKMRSGLLDTLRHGATSPPEADAFEDAALLGARQAPLRWIRRLLSPILALFFSPSALIHALRLQAGINARHEQYNEVSYELLENLVLEMTRLEIEVKKLEMRLESQSSRFDFAERRARSLEGIVRYRSEQTPEADTGRTRISPEKPEPVPAGSPAQQGAARDAEPAGGGDARRRRRRRRGRRGGPNRAPGEGGQGGGEQVPGGTTAAEAGGSEPDTGGGEGPGAPTVGPEPPERLEPGHDDQ
jgi:hypothetical protein